MDLATAKRYADKIVAWLSPKCSRIEIAGSIRRARPVVNDIDIVCIPKCTVYRDMFQAETGRQNHLWMFLKSYVAAGVVGQTGSVPAVEGARPAARSLRDQSPRIIVGNEYSPAMKQMIVQLPKVQLDLWFADESDFATRLLMRTGSKEHNIWLAERAHARGKKWEPYNGLFQRTAFSERAPTLIPCATEAEIYQTLGLEYIEPANREQAWLASNIHSGLVATI